MNEHQDAWKVKKTGWCHVKRISVLEWEGG